MVLGIRPNTKFVYSLTVSKLETASFLKIIRLPEALFPALPDVVSKMPTAGKMPV